jgi:putative tryptophan/tyrosine transport system substrate-binding protein
MRNANHSRPKFSIHELAGAKPADMPVEQPTKFELVVNTRTAKAIGINLPESLLVRADDVFD